MQVKAVAIAEEQEIGKATVSDIKRMKIKRSLYQIWKNRKIICLAKDDEVYC